MNQAEKNARQREYRLRTKNRCTAKYEKKISGFLMRLYRNMQSRINGIQTAKFHLYEGKELLDRDSFYTWAKGSPEFYELFGNYKQSGFDRKLAPSVDRVDSEKGYTLDNMEWVTHSENSRRGANNRHGN